MAEQKGFFRKLFGGIFKTLNVFRLIVINLIFFFIVFAVIGAIGGIEQPTTIKNNTALVIAPKGDVVEEIAGDPAEVAMSKLLGEEQKETLLKDIIIAIKKATTDKRITALVINPNQLENIGLNKLQELKTPIAKFKESGKKVIAVADGMTQKQYYLAALADEILLNPEGYVFLEGLGRYRLYYKEAIEKLEADVRLIRVGTYKSAGEPFIRNSMSDAAKEANLSWLDSLWNDYLDDIAILRNIEKDHLMNYVTQLADNLAAAEGDFAQMALEQKMVDRLATRQEIRDHIIQYTSKDPKTHSYRKVGIANYVKTINTEEILKKTNANKVAVVVARGAIVDGKHPPGTVGGESTSKLIRKARNDDQVKAIVLRVDSPGGSVFASELIRQEVELTKKAGKPIIASMGTVAASGGYWISMSADQIWASPTTITGSIGIFGLFTSFSKTINKIGLHFDGVGTTDLISGLHPLLPIQEEIMDIVQQNVEHGYQQFIAKVAEERKMNLEEVDAVAQGRVWSGQQAHEHGLVDHLGYFDDAVSAAAELANLGENYQIKYIIQELSPAQEFIMQLAGDIFSFVGIDMMPDYKALLSKLPYEYMQDDLNLLMNNKNKYSINAYCFCEI